MVKEKVNHLTISSKAHDNLEITKRRMKQKYTGTMVQVHIGLVMTSKALSPGARLFRSGPTSCKYDKRNVKNFQPSVENTNLYLTIHSAFSY